MISGYYYFLSLVDLMLHELTHLHGIASLLTSDLFDLLFLFRTV